jgi:hypothetical protein
MRCSVCGTNVDHHTNYAFLVNGRTVIQCDVCREAYLAAQVEAARPKRVKRK